MDWDRVESQYREPEDWSDPIAVGDALRSGRLAKPHVSQIMRIYAAEFGDLISAARQLGAEPGREIWFIRTMLTRMCDANEIGSSRPR